MLVRKRKTQTLFGNKKSIQREIRRLVSRFYTARRSSRQQTQRVNLYSICLRCVPLPIKPILLTSTKCSERYSGYDNY